MCWPVHLQDSPVCARMLCRVSGGGVLLTPLLLLLYYHHGQ
jgi:hypothetical protein